MVLWELKGHTQMWCQSPEFPKSHNMRVVQDNLNTHDVSAFYEHLPADEARMLAERMAKNIKIDWQFSIQTARTKLNSHYVKVQSKNQKFNNT